MLFENFDSVVRGLYEFFNYKNPPTSATIEKWFEKVKHIPVDALGYIERWMQDDRDSMPRNVAKAFNKGWYLWQAANPARMTFQRTECDDCGGKGFLWYAKRDGSGGFNSRSVVCGACENYKRTLGSLEGLCVTTRGTLEGQGFALFPSEVYWRQIHPRCEGDNDVDVSLLSSGFHGGRPTGRGDSERDGGLPVQ